MGLNDTVSAERVHIGFFGMRNAGKSSLVNAVTGQELAVVSDVKGTTTDPVKKAMELLPLGPVVIIDTPGIDDEGELGELRIKKAKQALAQTDIAVLVVDSQIGLCEKDKALIEEFKARKTPYIIAYNKSDLGKKEADENAISVSAKDKTNINELKERIASLAKGAKSEKRIVADLIQSGDTVVLVIPIDESAPKGRLILPQQQTIRDILDSGCTAICCRDTELVQTLDSLAKKPKLVITDSQAFGRVSKDVPDDIPLTSFSILFARYKGDLAELVKGAAMLSQIKDGDRILIAEGCTHHRQCNDIGTVKMPGWIEKFSNAKPNFSFTSGTEFPENPEEFRLIVHCGGCMLNEKEMQSRIGKATQAGVPVINYGIAIAHMNGILRRSIALFPDVLKILEQQ
ncbi:MAG: [FeFe] hydrogenase H-cluster maturation GTPase HydF [Clostridia bacterium]|nr:[FeFe] hydrogenase H-cluster maturation GTPase HydF [Clostridia bacterium]